MEKEFKFEVLGVEEMGQIRGGGDENEKDQQGMPVPPPIKTFDSI